MANFFESFRAGMGQQNTGPEDSTPSDNQARVALEFARARHNSLNANGQQRSSADQTIARSMQNGRHAFSESVLQGYATAGAEVDEELNTMLGELDALAVSSQAIATMDNATRQRYINRGFREFDSSAITEREAELQQLIMDRSRGVLTENESLDRELKRMAVDNNRMSITESRMTLAAKEADARYKSVTEGMTFDQLYDAYQKGGISGVPRTWLAGEMQARGQLEYEARQLKTAMTPGGAGDPAATGLSLLMGLGTGAVGQKPGSGAAGSAKGLDYEKISEAIAYNFTGDQIDALISEYEEARLTNPEASAAGTGVTLPGFGVTVPLPVILKARGFSTEIANMGVKPDDLGRLRSTQARILSGQTVFADSLVQLGGTISANSAAQAKVARHYGDANAALKAGDVAGAETALKLADDEAGKVIDAMITTRPKAQQGFLTDLRVSGRPNSPEAVSDFLSAETPTVALERLKAGSPYHEAATLVFSEMRSFEDNANAVATAANGANVFGALAQVDPELKRVALRDQLLDNASVSLYSKTFNASVGERIASVGLQGALLGRIKELQSSLGPKPTETQLQEVALLSKAAETVFGADWKRGRMSQSFYRQFPLTDDNGDPILDAQGQPLETKLLDVKSVIAALAPVQVQLRDAGSDYQLFSAMIGSVEKNAEGLAGELLPGNDPLKQAVFYMANGSYRSSSEMDANTAAMSIVTQQAELLNQAIDTAEALPTRVTEVIEAARGSQAEQRLIKQRAEEIVGNWDKMYDPALGGVAREKLGDPTTPRNSIQARRAAQTQAVQEMALRQRDSKAVITGETLRDDRILMEVLRDQ